jgi:DNA-binding NarL/FixJ family response regulator
MRPVRLLIVDDHRVFAEGLEAVFLAEPGFEPLGAVTDPGQVVGVVAARQPDAVIMDVQLGDVSGIDLTAMLTAQPAAPLVIVLTAYSDTATAISAVRAGAVGFVSKEGPAEHIVTAVRAAVLGGTWFPAGLLSTVIAAAEDPAAEPLGQLFVQLTDREREVLKLLVCGLDRKAISDRLHRSPDTVKTHIRNIAAKLGTRSAAEAVAVALSAGLRPELAGRAGRYDAVQLPGSGAPSGAGAAAAGTDEGLTNVLPPGPASTASSSALPSRYLFHGRNHMVQPLSHTPARGLPVTVTGSPGTSIL